MNDRSSVSAQFSRSSSSRGSRFWRGSSSSRGWSFSRGASSALRSLLFCCLCAGCAGRSVPATETPAGAGTDASRSVDAKLVAALAGPQRTDQERARDRYRHPREMLELFGLTPEARVVELSAGQGWFTAILGPVLAEKGSLAITLADPHGPPDAETTKGAVALLARLAKDPASFGKVKPIVTSPNGDTPLGPDGSADLVLTFRNLHNWIQAGTVDKVLATSFRVLRPGGTFGIEEHRARADAPTDPKAIGATGYVPEAFAIALIERAGFKLVTSSELNANPKDTKDYPSGVWTLPPTLRLGAVDREKYLAIGESDRMTLRFVKP
jgi:predicted methyltransferase